MKTPLAQAGKAFQKRLRLLRLKKAGVKAGILASKNKKRDDGELTNAAIAYIHEYGTSTIPARPFIRPPVLEKQPELVVGLAKAMSKAMVDGNAAHYERALEITGLKMQSAIRKYVTAGQGVPPTLKAATIKAKGSSRPLVDTGQMVGAVSYEVVKK